MTLRDNRVVAVFWVEGGNVLTRGILGFGS